MPDQPLLVDIGAGRGHDLMGFRKRFPDAPGKLILEDLETVIDEVHGAQDLEAARIETVSFDFFAQIQPVKGRDFYGDTFSSVILINACDLQVPALTISRTSSTTGPTRKQQSPLTISSRP